MAPACATLISCCRSLSGKSSSHPNPLTDRIDPQSPSEGPVTPEPIDAPGVDLFGVEAPPPDVDIPDTAQQELTPDQFSG